MQFPLSKYEEIPAPRRNTLQVFITTRCNLKCYGCFARKVMSGEEVDISFDEYKDAVAKAYVKGVKQINLLGGEPLLHPNLKQFIRFNHMFRLKTTVYTNGYMLDEYKEEDFLGAKIRVSLYSSRYGNKNVYRINENNLPLDFCFMVSRETHIDELLEAAQVIEEKFKSKVFFISSLRELDNQYEDFFEDTDLTMPLLKYKQLIHLFLEIYKGNLDIHISKRGVFESTTCLAGNKCKFANYFIGNRIIQCPYDIVNLKFQNDYEFDKRYCQHNSSCLMSKVVYRKKL